MTDTYTVRVRRDSSEMWAEVDELPGCFASGSSVAELWEALAEAVTLYTDFQWARTNP